MGFLDFFFPKWKHYNPEVRQQAVVTLDDQSVLADIAISDEVPQVRLAAVEKLEDPRTARKQRAL